MSNQEIVRTLIDNGIKLHTVRGIQCVRYQAIKPHLHQRVKCVFNTKTTVSFPVLNFYSKSNALMWDSINRVKYIRLQWLFEVWKSNKKEYVFVNL